MLRWFLASALLVVLPAADLCAAELTGTLQRIKQTGKIRIGLREAQPHMSSLGKEGVPVGYAVDLCAEVVAETRKTLGVEAGVEYVAVTAENRFDALADNSIDLLCGATTRTISRGEKVDFTLPTFVTSLVRLYLLNAGTGKLTIAQEAAIKDAILNWKFWLDEPNTTYVEMWTENHQILNHSIEYLAGQTFPDEVFTNNRQTGRWHMEHGRVLLLQWIELRARTGFSEWDSETYYPEDLAPLLNLVDFANDPAVSTRAAMLVDVILFDTAVDSFYGQFATSHGRVTASSIKSAFGSMTTINALAWGQGKFTFGPRQTTLRTRSSCCSFSPKTTGSPRVFDNESKAH